MRLAVIAALCVSVLFAGVAQAQVKKGDYAKDIEAKEWANTDEPISLHELRGMTVVVFFWVSWHPGGEYIAPLMNILNSKIGKSRGVYVLGLTDAERSRGKIMIEKEKVIFPIGFESKTYEEYGISTFPYVVMIDANGKVYWTGWPGEKGGNALVEEIFKCNLENPPTKTHPEEAAKAYLQDAREALREDKFQAAFRAADDAIDRALTGDPLKTLCQDMLDLIEALGRDKLAQADRAMEEGRFDDAVALADETESEFKGMEVSRIVRKRTKLWEKKYPEFKQKRLESQNVNTAETMLQDAIDRLNAPDPPEAYEKYGQAYEKLEQIVEKFGSAPTAAKAQTVLDRMKKNDGVMGYVRDYKASRECKSLLTQARAYRSQGSIEKSKALFKLVLEKFPDTIWAEEAAGELAEMP